MHYIYFCFIEQGYITFIKNAISNITNYLFQINAVLLNFLFMNPEKKYYFPQKNIQ